MIFLCLSIAYSAPLIRLYTFYNHLHNIHDIHTDIALKNHSLCRDAWRYLYLQRHSTGKANLGFLIEGWSCITRFFYVGGLYIAGLEWILIFNYMALIFDIIAWNDKKKQNFCWQQNSWEFSSLDDVTLGWHPIVIPFRISLYWRHERES